MGASSSKKEEEEKRKRQKKEYEDRILQTKLYLKKRIKEYELKIINLELQVNKLKETAKEHLKRGDKINAKKLLLQKKDSLEEIELYNKMLIKYDGKLMKLKNAKAMSEIAETIKKSSREIIESIIKIKEQEEEVMEGYSDENQNEGQKEMIEEQIINTDINNELLQLEKELCESEWKEFPDAYKDNTNKSKINKDNMFEG